MPKMAATMTRVQAMVPTTMPAMEGVAFAMTTGAAAAKCDADADGTTLAAAPLIEELDVGRLLGVVVEVDGEV